MLREGLEALGFGAAGGPAGGRDGSGLGGLDAVADLLERYLAELDRWNARFGFVKATGDELVAKHALDSIAGAATVAGLCAGGAARGVGGEAAGEGTVPGEPGGVEPLGAAASRGAGRGSARPRGGVLDVGSGAGFPGIPLAIALPEIRFSLLERSGKKCAFLENCRALLGLANVTVKQEDLSAASGSFDVVTFRAVAPLDRFLADLARSKVAWRSVAAYKGRRDRIEEELAALGPAAPYAEIVRLEVPFVDEERHLVVLQSAERRRSPERRIPAQP
jgi:16S rRNA (guanine527-N7)-methyltransferase